MLQCRSFRYRSLSGEINKSQEFPDKFDSRAILSLTA
jgi:hypothetical protein